MNKVYLSELGLNLWPLKNRYNMGNKDFVDYTSVKFDVDLINNL